MRFWFWSMRWFWHTAPLFWWQSAVLNGYDTSSTPFPQYTWAPCGSTRIFVSLVFCWIQLLTGAYCPKHHRKAFLKCHRLEMALNYGRATLFSILSTMSVSQPLSSLDKPGSGWHYPSETNSPRMSGGAFEKESYSYTRIKFKANIRSNGLFWVFGAKCEQSDW